MRRSGVLHAANRASVAPSTEQAAGVSLEHAHPSAAASFLISSTTFVSRAHAHMIAPSTAPQHRSSAAQSSQPSSKQQWPAARAAPTTQHARRVHREREATHASSDAQQSAAALPAVPTRRSCVCSLFTFIRLVVSCRRVVYSLARARRRRRSCGVRVPNGVYVCVWCVWCGGVRVCVCVRNVQQPPF